MVVGQGGGEEARGGGVRGVVVGAGRNRASVDVEGDAQRRSLGNDETSLALQVGVEGFLKAARRKRNDASEVDCACRPMAVKTWPSLYSILQ